MTVVPQTAILRAICAVGLCCTAALGISTASADDSDLVAANSIAANVVAPTPSPSDVAAPPAAAGTTLQQPNVSQAAVGNSCGPTCGNGSWCGCDSHWYVSVGAVFLERSRPDPATIASPSTGPGSIVSASDFGFNWNAGPDITVARRMDCGLIWEARYFNDLTSSSNFEVDNVTTFRTAGIGVTILGGGSLFNTYTTQLDSTELNLHLPLSQGCTVLAGVRAIELKDDFNMDIVNAINTNWNELNRMYGGQIGLDMALFNPGNPLQFTAAFKAGVYSNSADNRLVSQIVSGDTASATSTAFVGDIDVSASYRFSQHMAIRGGYEVLWIDNLALAGDAAAATTQAAGGSTTALTANGRVWYNGATVEMDFTW